LVKPVTRRKRVTEFSDNGPEKSDRWHLNLGIPVVFIITSFVSTAVWMSVGIWYASSFNSRVNRVEELQTSSVQILEGVRATAVAQGNQLARLDEKGLSTQATLARIEALLMPVKPRQ
jgi:hypothetical protein